MSSFSTKQTENDPWYVTRLVFSFHPISALLKTIFRDWYVKLVPAKEPNLQSECIIIGYADICFHMQKGPEQICYLLLAIHFKTPIAVSNAS